MLIGYLGPVSKKNLLRRQSRTRVELNLGEHLGVLPRVSCQIRLGMSIVTYLSWSLSDGFLFSLLPAALVVGIIRRPLRQVWTQVSGTRVKKIEGKSHPFSQRTSYS